MKVNELLEAWVLKNKSGKEKRFKDDKSQAAKDWVASSSPEKAKKPEKFSTDWWKARDDGYTVLPWTKISDIDIGESRAYASFLKDDLSIKNADFTLRGHTTKDSNGVRVAVANVTVIYHIDDDEAKELGLDGPTEDSVQIKLERDPQSPKKLILKQ